MIYWHKQLKWFGWSYDVKAVIRNHHLPVERDYMINPIMKEVIFDAFRMDANYARIVWKIMKSFQIRYIHAYPSGAYQFLKMCKRQNLDTSFMKVCFLASEGVTDEQRNFISDELGIKIYSFYGHSEKLIMAGNCPESTFYHIEATYGYCELVDKMGHVIQNSGVWGEMVGTTFINRYFPLIRYRTGDYSKYALNTRCPIHDTQYKLLDGVSGRWDKSLIYKLDGTTTSITALNLHSSFYEHIDGIQYIQEQIGFLRVLLIRNAHYTDDDEAYLLQHVGVAMGDEKVVKIEYVDKLRFLPNGKFLPLVSSLNL